MAHEPVPPLPSAGKSPSTLLELAKKHPHLVHFVSDYLLKKTIGEGAFGEVWLASHRMDKTEVASKVVKKQELDGADLKMFIREIDVMASCTSRFIVPIVGFTIETPYAIMTKYMENDNLHNFLKREQKSGKPNPTRHQMIAIGIAWALRNMHRRGFVHRDVKPANILMDKNYLPRLADFGLARAREKYMTRRVGTLQYMAPELYKKCVYTSKVDVYAFGMTLYEMSEDTIPFKGMDQLEILNQVELNQLRPSFTKKTPDGMKALIERCWATNPRLRPTMSEVVKELIDGTAMFKGAKKADMKKFLQMFEDRENELVDQEIVPPEPSEKSLAAIRRLEEKFMSTGIAEVESAAQEEEEEDDIKPEVFIAQVKKDESDNESTELPEGDELERILELARTCTEDNFDMFFNSLKEMLEEEKSVETMEELMNLVLAMVLAKESLIPKFLERNFFNMIQLKSEAVTEAAIDFMGIVFDKLPNEVRIGQIDKLLRKLILARPNQILQIFALYVSHFDECDDPTGVADLILLYAEVFADPLCAPLYIEIFHFLIQKPNYNTRMPTLMRILYALARRDDKTVARAALQAVCHLYEPQYDKLIGYEEILKYLKDDEMADITVSFLLRLPTLPPSRSLCAAMVERAKKDPRCTKLLMSFASQNLNNLSILVYNTTWMNFELPTLMDTFTLFLAVFKYPQSREQIREAAELPAFLMKCSESRNEFIISALPSVLKRTNANQEFINKLSESGFMKSYLSYVLDSDDVNVISNGLIVIDMLARVGYCDDMRDALPQVRKVLARSDEATTRAITILVTLSYFPKYHDKLRELKLDVYFERLMNSPAYAAYASTVLGNMKQ